jgi:hypothetical protein
MKLPYAMKTYKGVEVYVHVFFSSALVGGERSAFPPWGKSSRYPLDTELGGSQSRSGPRGKERNLAPTGTRTSTRRPSICYDKLTYFKRLFR